MIIPERIAAAKQDGKRWKLPEMIPLDHPLAAISGPINALMFTTKYLGEVTIIRPGTGREATSIALLSDILDFHRKITS